MSSNGDFEEKEVELPEVLYAPGLDIGDIAVDRCSGGEFHFLVHDEQGVPIEGATVRVLQKSATSDSGGRGSIDFVAAGQAQFLAGAPDREARVFERTGAGGTREDPEVFVLARGSRLTLVLQGAEGTRIPRRRVTLVILDDEFPMGLKWGQDLCGGTPISHGMTCTDDGEIKIPLLTDDRGELVLFNFYPGEPIVIRVEDGPGSILLEDRLVSPEPGKALEHVLRIPHAMFSLDGVVLDETGVAVPDVRVRLTASSAHERVVGWRNASSDSEGRYRLKRLFPREEPVLLTAELPGYVTACIEELTISPSTEIPALILQRGVRLQVQLVDQAGGPVPVREVTATVAGYPEFEGVPLDPGCFVFTDLPARKMLVRTTVGPHTYEIEHDSSRGNLRWELPTFGTMTACLLEGTEQPSDRGRGIYVLVTSIDAPEISTITSFPREEPGTEMWSRPVQLEPGPWRVELWQTWWEEEGVRQRAPLGPTEEVEVRAGEETRVAF